MTAPACRPEAARSPCPPSRVGVTYVHPTNPNEQKWGHLIAAIGAVLTVFSLFFAFWQLDSERDRQRTVEVREQARQVAAWVSDASVEGDYVLSNTSAEPVYEVLVASVAVQGAGPRRAEEVDPAGRALVSVLPPGRWRVRGVDRGAGMGLVFGAEVAFSDSAGVPWVRRASGDLQQLDDGPIDHFGVDLPATFTELEPAEGDGSPEGE